MILLSLVPLMTTAQDELFEKATFTLSDKTLPYRIMMPENLSDVEKYPLVLFLHGSGERGNDNKKQLIHGGKLFADSADRTKFTCIAVFPQCPKESYWANVKINSNAISANRFKFRNGGEPTGAMTMLMGLVQELEQHPNVDKNRIYVVGLSMGGMGTFELLSRMPKTFAAAIAICGGDNPKSVTKYHKVPMWIIHGAKDKVVVPRHSIRLVDALLQLGAFPKFTLYDKADHNSWDLAFEEDDFFPWLFSHERK